MICSASVVDVKIDIPPRYMWGWGDSSAGLSLPGYCGETSLQSNGIFWGQYVSSEYVHKADGNSELLLGTGNEVTAAKALKMTYELWNNGGTTPDSADFIQWTRDHIDLGHGVVFGAFDKVPNGQSDYDHIMPIVGYQKDSVTDDTIGLWLNDLWSPQSRLITSIANRKQCTMATDEGNPYDYCIPKDQNFAIAFLGVTDTSKETMRMKLIMPSWTEPDWGAVDGVNDKPVSFTVKAIVYGLTVGRQYSILRFSSLETLPSSGFLKAKFTKRFDFTATSASMTFSALDTFLSNSTMFYRTVTNTEATPKPPANPSTVKPTTTKPTTAKPTTAKPTTAKPTTGKPTTVKPTTAKPTTAKPTTTKPTTAKPTPTVKPAPRTS